MEVKIFVDVLFIINFIIDYILLSVTSFFVKKTPKFLRMCLAAAVGALYATVAFFLPLGPFFSLCLTFGVAFLMIFFAFGTKSARSLLKDASVFYLVSIAASGLGFGVIFSGKLQKTAVNNGIFYADINVYTLLFVFLSSLLIIHLATGYIRKQKIKSSFMYEITIEKNGRSVSHSALFDSANFMTDPISQKSVIIAEWQAVAPLFDEQKITEAIISHPEDFVYIGCHTLCGNEAMFAFSPDSVTSHEIRFSVPVLIAVTERTLDKSGAFCMLLPNTANIQNHQERI